MKYPKLTASIILIFFGCLELTTKAQISLQEGWVGTTLDTNNWSVTLPFPDSAYSVNNGSITLSNRATILSTDSFFSPIVITGSISLSTFDISRILTRTSGEVQDGNIYKELNGLWFSFYGVGAGNGGVYIQSASNAGNQQLAYTPYTFDPNVLYDFVLTDNGTNASIFINSSELANAVVDPLFSEGNQVAIYSRGTLFFAGPHSSTLGPLEITAVPEPQTTALLGLSALILCVALLGKKTSQKTAPSTR
jgi:hypothetical protein